LKVLTVVGRAQNRVDFEKNLEAHLSPEFPLHSVVPLDSDEEAKTFLSYIMCKEDDEDTITELFDRLTLLMYQVELHEDQEEAGKFATENYGEQAYSDFELPLKAQEIKRRDIFALLMKNDDIAMMRGKFNGKPIIALVTMTHGYQLNDSIATPYAILLDDELGKQVELPFKSSYEVE
jgi:hypothetical protein